MGRTVRMNDVVQHARLTGDYGHTHLTLIDSQNPGRDVYAMVTIAVWNSHRTGIGHGVTNPPGISVAGFSGPFFIGE